MDGVVQPPGQEGGDLGAQQIDPGRAAQHQGSAGEDGGGFALDFHHEGDALRGVSGSVDDPDQELAHVEFVVLLKADRGKEEASGGAGAHLAAGLIRQFPCAGDKVVVDVGLKGVGDAGAVVGCDLDVLVNVPGGVDDYAPAGLFRTDNIAVVGQAFYPHCFDEHGYYPLPPDSGLTGVTPVLHKG